ELGTNRAGDIEELCHIAAPNMGIITNVGKEHLEGFGSIEGVAKAEGELFDYLSLHDGHAFVNCDDKWVLELSKQVKNKTEYSMSQAGISGLSYVPTVAFEYKGQTYFSNLPGIHNFQNIIAVLCIANYLGLNAAEMSQGITSYIPRNNRSQILKGDNGNKIFLDAYNANPSSVEMALKTLSEMPGKKLVILGDMFELGAYEAQEHQAINDLCANLLDTQSILVGKAFVSTHSKSNQVQLFENKEDALEFIKKNTIRETMILIKGSRGMKMEDFLICFKTE
ncbi:MAG: UDP-N-acetylmuramoyl-tripeptide--D-alanyl-D-alanine ligase, partial [Bacteroidia bacterium]|nr:UDP-N-acetylmuramoyl-tripeptide--D-alanyl-D-alanine ligase [Bacteroidia bacterium]